MKILLNTNGDSIKHQMFCLVISRSLVLGMCVLLNINAPAFAQEKPSPLFRGGIEVVAVDVTVVDDNGAPVKDLSVDDFILKVENEPRHIVSAEYMSHLPTPEAELLGPPPSHFSSNEDLGPGRHTYQIL